MSRGKYWLIIQITSVAISVSFLDKIHSPLNINWVLDVGKCREINDMKTILSLSCKFTIPAPYLLVQCFPKLMCKFQLGFSKKPSHIEMRFYFIITIPANYMTISDFQFVGNPALSAKLGRCQKCTECFSENHLFSNRWILGTRIWEELLCQKLPHCIGQ